MHSRYLDDFTVGQTFKSRAATMTESEIVDFALKFDPQPMHLDVHGAQESGFGNIIASGFHTMSMAFRLWTDLGLYVDTNVAGLALEDVAWKGPVFPGDTIRCIFTVKELTPSRSKPDRGVMKVAFDVRNQKDETVLTYTTVAIVLRRPDEEG